MDGGDLFARGISLLSKVSADAAVLLYCNSFNVRDLFSFTCDRSRCKTDCRACVTCRLRTEIFTTDTLVQYQAATGGACFGILFAKSICGGAST
jgi:hypothetical protein